MYIWVCSYMWSVSEHLIGPSTQSGWRSTRRYRKFRWSLNWLPRPIRVWKPSAQKPPKNLPTWTTGRGNSWWPPCSWKRTLPRTACVLFDVCYIIDETGSHKRKCDQHLLWCRYGLTCMRVTPSLYFMRRQDYLLISTYIYIYCIILFDIRMPKILKRVCCAVTMTVWRHRNRLWIMSFWTATRLLAGSSPSWGEWILGWICHWLVFPRSADEACQLGWQASL